MQVGSIHNLSAVTPVGTRAPKLGLPLRGTDCQLRQVSVHGLSQRLKEGEELAWGGEQGATGVKVWGFSPRGSALGPWEGKQRPQLQGSARPFRLWGPGREPDPLPRFAAEPLGAHFRVGSKIVLASSSGLHCGGHPQLPAPDPTRCPGTQLC